CAPGQGDPPLPAARRGHPGGGQVKLTHITLSRPVQTEMGLIKGTLLAKGSGGSYEMTFLTRLGFIEVQRDEWKKPVYLMRGCIDSIGTAEPITPDVGFLRSK